MKKIFTVLTTLILASGLFFGCDKKNKEDNSLEELKRKLNLENYMKNEV